MRVTYATNFIVLNLIPLNMFLADHDGRAI
jgi:hypothetical protein